MDKSGEWKLAPAYDMCFAYNPANFWVKKHALSINFKREQFTVADFMAVAQLINCRKPEEIISEVKNVVSHWQDFMHEACVSDILNDTIKEAILVDVVS
jgi:serine/threonine-protein kinase HipA